MKKLILFLLLITSFGFAQTTSLSGDYFSKNYWARTNTYRIGLSSLGDTLLITNPFITNQIILGSSNYVYLNCDAANTLALRNSTNAQTFNLYNTYTDASNYERLEIKFSSNQAYIQMKKLGTGVARTLNIAGDGTISIQPTGAVYIGGGGSIVLTNKINFNSYNFIGNLNPDVTNSYDIGSSSKTIRTGYFGTSIFSPIVYGSSSSGGNLTLSSISHATKGKIEILDNILTVDSLNIRQESSLVLDDGSITLATGVSGFGQVMAGDNQEWTMFRFSADGTVTLISNTTNVANTDSDGNLCVYDAGSGVAIKNRLGSSKRILLDVKYY